MENKIVCIDRSPRDLLRVQSILDSHYDVTLISDATFGLKEIIASPPRVLLLGTDIPGMGALELVQHLAQAYPTLLSRALILSTKEQLTAAQILFDEGAAGLVHKPLDPDNLFNAVREVFIRAGADHISYHRSQLTSHTHERD